MTTKTIEDYKKDYAAAQSSANNTAKTVPAGFTGSAAGVAAYTLDQEAIKAQMNANSQAWHTASAEEQERLHRENQQLAALLGGSVSFDSVSGTWGGSARQPGQQTAQVEDYSSYLEQMYAAQKAAALAQLDAAYQSNLAALDRAEAGIGEQYQTARNNTAGASELSKRNFAEYAAASGLNSGTGGQAELGRNVTLQNNLNSLNTAEADTISDLQLQRANAEIEYNNAIAQAEAQGDYELASALYQEKVRVQNTLLEMEIQQQKFALQQYQLEYQAQRDAVSDSQWQSEFDFKLQQYADQLAAAEQALSGSAGSNGGSTGGSGGTGSTAAKTMDYAGLFAAAEESGYAKSFIANNYKQYGFTSSTGLYDGYTQWLKEGGSSAGYKPAESPVPDTSEYGSGYWELLNTLSAIESSGRNVTVRAKDAIMSALESNKITENAATKLLKQYGI